MPDCLGDGVAAIMQSASDTWLSQLASYKFDVDASRVADVIAVINKAAAPVGESLIMTAFGLLVAIPSVMAYNVFGRLIAGVVEQLDGLAHDLLALYGEAA